MKFVGDQFGRHLHQEVKKERKEIKRKKRNNDGKVWVGMTTSKKGFNPCCPGGSFMFQKMAFNFPYSRHLISIKKCKRRRGR